jgi:hypothetical protein
VAWLIILGAALLSCFLWRISKPSFVLLAVVGTAGYSLLALDLLSKNHLWLPIVLPFTLIWFFAFVRLFVPAPKREIVSPA